MGVVSIVRDIVEEYVEDWHGWYGYGWRAVARFAFETICVVAFCVAACIVI